MWNPFKMKTPEQELQDLIDGISHQSSGSGVFIDPLGPQQSSSGITIPQTQTQAQNPFAQAGLFGGFTPQQIQQMLGSFGVLSKEEQEEMARLKVEHSHEIKKLKLAAFKKIAPEMRQFVINALSWQDHVAEINNVVALKPARLSELELKESQSKMFGQSLYATSVSATMFSDIFKTIGIPEGITADDLKQAHLEATVEEEMLNGQKEG